jgi:hypothetical protein
MGFVHLRSAELTIKTISDFRGFLSSIFILLFFHLSASAQPIILENGQNTPGGTDTGIHLDTPTRAKIDLAGVWNYSLDDETWGDVRVPSSFDYQGRITFVRKFTVEEAMLNSSSFKFVALGINYDAEIYINDVFLGKHVGGYTMIETEVPDNTLQLGGENAVKIIVTNTLGARSTVPLRKQIWGWRNYGGILRDIYIMTVPKIWIDEQRIQTALDRERKLGSVRVEAVLNSKSLEQMGDTLSARARIGQTLFVLELLDKYSGAIVGQSTPVAVSLQPNRDLKVEAALTLNNPKLWSPENPDLYLLKSKIIVQEGRQTRVVDEYTRNVGFVKVEMLEGRFIVNGSRVTLNGIVWQEDSPEYGASLTYERMEKDVALIKTMGANAIRFAFHPPHPYMLNLCSRYGLFALVEIPVWNVPGEILGQESFQAIAETMVGEMIQRDHPNPSILAWGIGDDFDSSDPRARAYVERIVGVVRRLDHRPTYYGSRMMSDDRCSDLVDIAALNLRTTDMTLFKSRLSKWKAKHPQQPVLVLRYGKEIEPGNRNGYSDPMSQESQGKFFEKFYGAIKEANIAGSFISAFADWRGDRPIMTVNSGEPYLYPMGVVNAAREKREAYDIVKSLYNNEKLTSLPIGRFRSSFPFAHIAYGFFIIFVVAYVYHYNRRFNETFKRSLIRPYNFFADLRDVRSVSIPQTILLAVAVAMTLGLILSGILYHYRTNIFADYVLTQIVVGDGVKEWLIDAAWNPFKGMAAFTFVLLFWYPLTALCIKLFSMLVKRRINWYHAFAVAVWGTLPLVMLSPLGMAVFKLFQTRMYVLPVLLLIGLFLAWSLARVLKGVAVIYDIAPFKAYVGGVTLLVVLFLGVALYYESVHAITAYLEFIVHIARSLG